MVEGWKEVSIYLVLQLSPGYTASWLYQKVFCIKTASWLFLDSHTVWFIWQHECCIYACIFAWLFSLLPSTTGGDGRSYWTQRWECCSICTIWTAVLKDCCRTQAQDTKGKDQTLTWQHTLIIFFLFPFLRSRKSGLSAALCPLFVS